MNELKRLLEIKLKNVMNKHIQFMTGKDVLIILWWSLFNKEKGLYLISLLEFGIMFNYAIEIVKKSSKKERREKIKEYIDNMKKGEI